MKTTLDLPDELYVAAKKRAAEERRSLRDLVASGLRQQLHGPARQRRRSPIRWVTVRGGPARRPRCGRSRSHARRASVAGVIALDRNLLVYAHRSATPEHKNARSAIERAAASGAWGFAAPVVAEFWAVVTHPASRGRPSTPDEAFRFLAALGTPGPVSGRPAPASGSVWLK